MPPSTVPGFHIATTLEPCHTISLDYPAFRAKEHCNSQEYAAWGAFEFYTIKPPYRYEERYYPSNLVLDPAAWPRCNRNSRAETSFLTVYPCSSSMPETLSAKKKELFLELDPFVAAVKSAVKTPGSTDLYIDTFKAKDRYGVRSHLIRIERQTRFVGQNNVECQSLVMRLTTALDAATDSEEQWLRDIALLTRRACDRAVRHVQLRFVLEFYDFEKEIYQYAWKTQRNPKYEEFIDEVVTKLRGTTVTEKLCDRCILPCDAGSRQPMLMKCGHLFCRECLIENLCANVPAGACCRVCNEALKIPQPWLNFAAYGTKGNSHPADVRYELVEQYEMSLAELDVDDDEEDREEIVVNSNVLQGAWGLVLQCTVDLEPEGWAPHHLKAANWPEFKLVDETISRYFGGKNRKWTTTIPRLYDDVLNEVFRIFANKFASSGWKDIMSSEYLKDIQASPRDYANLLMSRMGLFEVIQRLLMRTLRFYHRRQCRVKQHENNAQARYHPFHFHGRRLQWCPSWLESREKAEKSA